MNKSKIKTRMALANHMFCIVLKMYLEAYPDFSTLPESDNEYLFKQFIDYINSENLVTMSDIICKICEFRFKEFLKNPHPWLNAADMMPTQRG